MLTHPCEVALTQDNIQQWLDMAEKLGKNHIAALKEQAERQGVKYATPA